MSEKNIVLAVDPGRDKCGVAVVEKGGKVLYKNVISRDELKETVENLTILYSLQAILVGDGTTSGTAVTALSSIRVDGKSLSVIKVNEYRTTDEARKRFWRENPPKGLKKLIPVSMQVPPVPVDDYVAVILAERYLDQKIENENR